MDDLEAYEKKLGKSQLNPQVGALIYIVFLYGLLGLVGLSMLGLIYAGVRIIWP